MEKAHTISLVILVLLFIGGVVFLVNSESEKEVLNSGETIDLPQTKDGNLSVEEALKQRRSIRSYKNKAITKDKLSQLLWAAQGITDEQRGFRTAPSAGALYPLEVYVDVKNVEGLKEGIYNYEPEEEKLKKIVENSKRSEIYQASLKQDPIKQAPALIIISGVYERSKAKYGDAGVKYTRMESGHVGQNIYLQATSLELGTVSIGAFDAQTIKELINAKGEPLYLMPIGIPENK